LSETKEIERRVDPLSKRATDVVSDMCAERTLIAQNPLDA